jgi:hypothetical protein
MSDFSTIEFVRPKFYAALIKADAINRHTPRDGEYFRALNYAEGYLMTLREAYRADLEKLETDLYRVKTGVPLYD